MSTPISLSTLSGMLAPMSRESLPQRIRRLIAEAVNAGQFDSERDAMDAAGLSPSYLAERVMAAEKNPNTSIRQVTLVKLAHVLGVSVAELTGEETTAPVIDIYPGRAFAVVAARALQIPEAAIQLVLRENPGHDPGRLYWFRRMESEAERLRPASDVPSKPR